MTLWNKIKKWWKKRKVKGLNNGTNNSSKKQSSGELGHAIKTGHTINRNKAVSNNANSPNKIEKTIQKYKEQTTFGKANANKNPNQKLKGSAFAAQQATFKSPLSKTPIQAKVKLMAKAKENRAKDSLSELNQVMAKYKKEQVQKAKLQNGMTDSDVSMAQNLARLPVKAQQQAYKSLEKGNSDVGIEKGFATRTRNAEGKAAKQNPLGYGAMQGFAKITTGIDLKKMSNATVGKEVTGKDVDTSTTATVDPKAHLKSLYKKMPDKNSKMAVALKNVINKPQLKTAPAKGPQKSYKYDASKKYKSKYNVEDTAPYKVGNVVGQMAGYGVTGGVLEGAIGKVILKKGATNLVAKALAETTPKAIASKTAEKLVLNALKKGKTVVTVGGKSINIASKARKVASVAGANVIAGAPGNVLVSASNSKNKKDFAKQLATNTALDVATGGLIEGVPAIAKGLKKTESLKDTAKSIKSFDNVPTKNIKKMIATKQKIKELNDKATSKTTVVEHLPLRVSALKKISAKQSKYNLDDLEKVMSEYKNEQNVTKGAKQSIKATPNKASEQIDKVKASGSNVAKVKDLDTKLSDVEKQYKADKIDQEDYIDQVSALKEAKKVEMSKFTNEAKVKTAKPSEATKPIETINTKPTTTKANENIAKVKEADEGIADNVKRGSKTNTPLDIEYKKAQKENPTYKNGTPSEIDNVKIPKALDTAMGKSGIVQDTQVRKALKADILSHNNIGYATKKQKVAFDDATKRVNEDATKTYDDFMMNNATKDSDIAKGVALYNHFSKVGDVDKASKAIEKTSMALTEAGRTINAAKLLMKATPSGRVRTALRVVDKFNEKYRTKLPSKIELKKETLAEVMNAKTDAEIRIANDKVQLELWNQLPVSFKEKWDSFRYLAMLGNPKTHIRNIIGNLIFAGPRKLKDTLATGGEKLAMKAGILDKDQGTKAILTFKDSDNIKFSKEIFDKDSALILEDSAKWNDSVRPEDSPVFDTKGLEFFRKWNGKLLNLEDRMFMKPAYAKSMAMFMKSRKLVPEDMVGDTLETAKAFAEKDALTATYRNYTELGNALSKIKNPGPDASGIAKAGGVVIDSTVPFTKTPINILSRAIDYSPVGLINGTNKLIKGAKDGDAKAISSAIDKMSAGLTGTGIVALGIGLNKLGIVEGEFYSDAKGSYDKDLGHQSFSVKIGDYSVTLDWAIPSAIPFFLGAMIGKLKESDNLTTTELIDSFSGMLTPVTELSMMQGLTNTIQGIYSNQSGGDKATTILTNLGTNYVFQAVPTLLGQIARTIDNTQRTTTSTAKSTVGKRLESALLRQKNKIPYLSKTSEPYVNKWGKEVNTGSLPERLVENFISPAYFSKVKGTSIDKEIQRLYGSLGSETKNSVVPKGTSSYDLSYGKGDVRMSKSNVTDYNKFKGTTSYTMVKALMNTDTYKQMTDAEKAKAISKIYTNSSKGAKATTLISNGKNDIKVMGETYNMGQGKINRLKEYKAKGHNVKNIIKEDMRIKMKSNGVNAKVVTAAALLEDNAKKDTIKYYGVKSKVKQVKQYLDNGGSTKELSDVQLAMTRTSHNKKGDKDLTSLEKALAISRQSDHARVYSLYDETKSKLLLNKYMNVARGLRKMGLKASDISNLKSKVDSNGNGYLTTEEATNGAEKMGKTSTEKSVVFDAIANWQATNPYGTRTFKAVGKKDKPKTETVKVTTIKKVKAPVQAILQTGEKVDLTKMSKSEVAKLMLNSKIIKELKFGTVNRAVVENKTKTVKTKRDLTSASTKASKSSSSSGSSGGGGSSSGSSSGGSSSGGGGSSSGSSANLTPAQQKTYTASYDLDKIQTKAQIKALLKAMLKNNY